MEIPELPANLLYSSEEERVAVENLCLQLGRVNYHWNVLHGTLQLIFMMLVNDRDAGYFFAAPAIDLWQTQKSDDGQRSLLKIFAEEKLKADPELRDALLWVISETGKLSTYRNDATHAIFFFAEETDRVVKVNPLLTASSRANRLQSTGHSDLFKCLIFDLFALDHYSGKIAGIVLDPRTRELPGASLQRRPKLLSAQLVERSPPGNPSRRLQTEAQPDQPPSSQA